MGESGMRALVTGAAGMIGCALVERLLREHWSVVGLSRRSQPQSHPKLTWLSADICHLSERINGLSEVDTVFHLAGQTSSATAKLDPIVDLNVNVVGLLRLLRAVSQQRKKPHVVIAGTATEVGIARQLPVGEGEIDKPLTFYDISKLTAEMYLKQFVREDLVSGCCLRLSNVFGASTAEQQADRGIIDKSFKRAMAGESLQIFGDGNYLRDYIHVDDVVSAFIAASAHREAVNGRHFVIGTGVGVLLKDAFRIVADIAEELTGRAVELNHVDVPMGLSPMEFRNFVADTTAFRGVTNWKPTLDLRSGLLKSYSGARNSSRP